MTLRNTAVALLLVLSPGCTEYGSSIPEFDAVDTIYAQGYTLVAQVGEVATLVYKNGVPKQFMVFAPAAQVARVINAEGIMGLLRFAGTVRTGLGGMWVLTPAAEVAAGVVPAAAPAAGATGGSIVVAGVTYVLFPVVAAVSITLAVDRAQNGNFIWEEVDAAGGWGVVMGFSANPSAAAIAGRSAVACHDQDRDGECRRAVGASVTDYSSWWLGSPWTCADVFADGTGTLDNNPAWNLAVTACGKLANSCVALTASICQ